jgi:hypothetical protein
MRWPQRFVLCPIFLTVLSVAVNERPREEGVSWCC